MTIINHLILFDIDGTLLRTQGAGRLSTKHAMLDVFGHASTIDTHHFGGKTDFYTLTELLSPHGFTQETIAERMGDFVSAMGHYMAQFIVEHPAHPLQGAMEAVAHLQTKPDVLIGIVTGNSPTSARIKLESAGYDPDWFVIGAYGSESINRDDLPRLALKRAEAHINHSIQPEQAVIIGDTAMDVQAARANGMRVIGVKSALDSTPTALEEAHPDYLLDSLVELFDVLHV
jgi:phosphoglycolate phosphatase